MQRVHQPNPPDGVNVHCGEGSLREEGGGGGLSSVALRDDEH